MLQGKMNIAFPRKAKTEAKKAIEATVDNQVIRFNNEIIKNDKKIRISQWKYLRGLC